MKNLRKLSKHELKSVLGGIEKCYYLQNGTKGIIAKSWGGKR